MNFIHEQFNQYFTLKIQIRTSNSLQLFHNFQPLEQHSNYDFSKIKGFTFICVFSACAKWRFFGVDDWFLDVKTKTS